MSDFEKLNDDESLDHKGRKSFYFTIDGKQYGTRAFTEQEARSKIEDCIAWQGSITNGCFVEEL